MAPADSKSGTNSSSYKSRGIFPTNTWTRTRAGKSHRPKKFLTSVKPNSGKVLFTSVPIPGCVPVNTLSGGGPPYFLCPVVTSRV